MLFSTYKKEEKKKDLHKGLEFRNVQFRGTYFSETKAHLQFSKFIAFSELPYKPNLNHHPGSYL